LARRIKVLGLTAIAAILFSANVPIANAQQLTSQPAVIQNGMFQNTEDGFRVHVPEGRVIQDVNNTGSTLLEEALQGYGILARLCPQEQQQALSNFGGGGTFTCEGSEKEIIHILRYPNLDTRLQLAFGVTTNNITTDNILLYHVQKLQEVGYSGIEIVNSTETTVNVTNAQTNQTISKAPAKLVEMTYVTNFAPNEIRTGHFILTGTNATHPNVGMTKGYSIFYEGNSTSAAVQTTTASGSLPSPTTEAAIRQILDSFELIAAQEVVQAEAAEAAQIEAQAETRIEETEEEETEEEETACDPSYPDVCIPPPPPDLDCGDDGVPEDFEVLSPDPHDFDRDNDGIGCESGSDQPEPEPA
jgi:hypothetical protein